MYDVRKREFLCEIWHSLSQTQNIETSIILNINHEKNKPDPEAF